MKIKTSAYSFADYSTSRRKIRSRIFNQINRLIDWEAVRRILDTARLKPKRKKDGRPSYDSLVLFRIELLRVWYGLSDGEIEDQVNDRLSFSRFAGIGLEDDVPDSTTVCRFATPRCLLTRTRRFSTRLTVSSKRPECSSKVGPLWTRASRTASEDPAGGRPTKWRKTAMRTSRSKTGRGEWQEVKRLVSLGREAKAECRRRSPPSNKSGQASFRLQTAYPNGRQRADRGGRDDRCQRERHVPFR